MKKSGSPKLPDLRARAQRPIADGDRRRHAGGDLRADMQAADAEGGDHRARGFAAGDYQPAHAAGDQVPSATRAMQVSINSPVRARRRFDPAPP